MQPTVNFLLSPVRLPGERGIRVEVVFGQILHHFHCRRFLDGGLVAPVLVQVRDVLAPVGHLLKPPSDLGAEAVVVTDLRHDGDVVDAAAALEAAVTEELLNIPATFMTQTPTRIPFLRKFVFMQYVSAFHIGSYP